MMSIDFDVPDYGTHVSSGSEGNTILYHPNNSILNHSLLHLLRKITCFKSNGHVLVIAPSEYAVKHHIQFFKRHLLTDSIGHEKHNKYDDSWPKAIVIESSRLSDLYSDGFKIDIDIDLIIFLECHEAMQDNAVIELMTYITGLDSEHKPKIHCFTSCILSDNCDFGTITHHVQKLEKFYGCKFLTMCDQFVARKIFSAPLQSFHAFEKEEDFSEPCVDALRILNVVKDMCSNFNFQFNEKFSQISTISSELFVNNTLNEIEYMMEELGEYGGSIAVLAAFRPLVRLFTFSENNPGSATKLMLSHLVCTLAKIRKVLEDDMFRVQISERAERFSSKRVQSLLNYLRDIPKSHKVLIIVNDPNTACILTLILQKVVNLWKKHSHISPELMLNSSYVPISDSWEDCLAWERNMEVYSRFISGKINTVILSGEPQGLDLPRCDVVFVWDKIKTFAHLMRAKNYVEDGTGRLLLTIEKSYLSIYEEELRKFGAIEIELKKILTGNLEDNLEYCGNDNKFMTSLGIEIKAENAISVLNRYSKNLCRDKFVTQWPVWQMEKIESNPLLYRAHLFLPSLSPVNNVKSNKMVSWQGAQQNAALQACRELYKADELNDDMLISKNLLSRTNALDDSDIQKQFECGLGVNNLRIFPQKGTSYSDDEDILCDIIFPQCLTSAQPRPNMDIYVHKIHITPVSEPPPPGDNRKTVLYELLCDQSTFAILSSKPLLEVCQFPVFLFGHELCVKFETLPNKLQLNAKEILCLVNFHCGLFMNILPIVQYFMQFNICNSQNSYLIAPLSAGGGVDWNVVKNNTGIPECRQLTHDEKMNLICTPESHERTIVKPWYRHLGKDQVYLVSEVCTDMSAESCFPTDEFDSFREYYMEKYKIILERPELPLLEAYLVNTKVNGLLPRSRSAKMRREEKMEDFREHMVPELCVPLLFPAALWLKLSSLPSVLHRLHRLLVVEEFRRLIISETGVGSVNIDLQPLTVDKSCLKDMTSTPKVPPSIVKRGLAIGNVKLEERKRTAQLKKAWKDTQEPVDIHRNMESLNFVEIRYFDEYLIKSKSSPSSSLPCLDIIVARPPDSEDSDSDSCSDSPDNNRVLTRSPKQNDLIPECINLTSPCISERDCGPQQHELLQVFTSSSSSDAVSMDRIQILGNAVLNVAASVFAYQYGLNTAGSFTSLCLHNFRSAFMRQNNLEMCSVRKNLCNRIKVLDFTPGEWIPPSFAAPSMLKQVLKSLEISPNVLQQIQLTEQEQLTGLMSEEAEGEILEVLTSFVNRGSARREEVYVDRQLVPGQTAAHCVEALVGMYFKKCGWQGALKLVGWLDLLPSEKLNGLLGSDEPQESSATIPSSTELLGPLESVLNYNFKYKVLLVKAMTHESFIDPSIEGNMDTLAFLGSSILDFLLTCYIYEHFVEVNPPEICRLREILSSTSTLAYLSVRHNLHKYLLLNSSSLLDAVDRFVKCQKDCLQPITDEVQLLLEEHECENVFQVEVPIVLGKLLPSLVGAVYLDSGKDLNIVWNSFKGIFLPELSLWRQDVPLSVVELLKDLSPAAHQVIFSNKTTKEGLVEVTCKVLMDNTREEVFTACGAEEDRTKTHAAKLALRNLLGSSFINT